MEELQEIERRNAAKRKFIYQDNHKLTVSSLGDHIEVTSMVNFTNEEIDHWIDLEQVDLV